MPGKARVTVQEGFHRVADIRRFIQFEGLIAGSGRLGGGSEEKYFNGR